MKRIVVALVALLFILPQVCAYTMEEAADALEKSEGSMGEILSMGFPVSRMNDTLEEARQLFDAQKLINESGGNPDFSIIVEKAGQVEDMRSELLAVHDEIVALESTIGELGSIDMSSIIAQFEDANASFYNERYSETRDSIELAYSRISEQQAITTKLASALDASRRNIVGIVSGNWPYLTVGFAMAILIAAFSRKRFSRFRIRRKMGTLEVEKDVIKGLIKETQRMYFDNGKISEETYMTRVKKFGEIIRDIERQIPLLRAELEGG